MSSLPVATERRSASADRALLAVIATLVVSNLMTNVVLPDWTYVPWNLAVAAAITYAALRVVELEHLGFGNWGRGLRWGLVLLAGMVVILAVGVAVPSLRELFDDERVDGSTWLWAYHVFVRIPLGTVVLEEVAFRAVLPALFAVRLGVLRGAVAASVLFGFWHVLAAWDIHEANEGLAGWFGSGAAAQAVAVGFAVLGTTVAGLWWCWVRYRSGSVLATMIGHVSSNSLAYTIAWLLVR